MLDSHRGWDVGALDLARQVAAAFGVPLYAATTTRLLVDLNRSIGHPQLFSEVTRALPRARRQNLVDRHYGHIAQVLSRDRAFRRIGSAGHPRRVAQFHASARRRARRADVAWLYDHAALAKPAFARSWMRQLAHLAPDLRLRRNYPYRGRGDGLTAALRRRHPDAAYVASNSRSTSHSSNSRPWDRLKEALVDSLKKALGGASDR